MHVERNWAVALGRIVFRVFDNVREAMVFFKRCVYAFFYGSAFGIPKLPGLRRGTVAYEDASRTFLI
jgi:hypothetical protein